MRRGDCREETDMTAGIYNFDDIKRSFKSQYKALLTVWLELASSVAAIEFTLSVK